MATSCVSDEGERSERAARFLARIPASWWRRNATALSPDSGLVFLGRFGRRGFVPVALRLARRVALFPPLGALFLALGAAFRANFRPGRLFLLRFVLLGERGQAGRDQNGGQQQNDGFFH